MIAEGIKEKWATEDAKSLSKVEGRKSHQAPGAK